MTKIIPSLCYNTYTYLPTPKYPVRKNRGAFSKTHVRFVRSQPPTQPPTFLLSLFRYAFWLAVDSSAASDKASCRCAIIVYATVTCDQLLQFDVICHITLLATIIAWRLSPMYYSSVVLSCTLRDLTWPSCTHPWSPELHPTAWKCCRKSELKEIICTLNSIRKGLPDSKIIWRRRRRRRRRRRTTAAKFEPTSLYLTITTIIKRYYSSNLLSKLG